MKLFKKGKWDNMERKTYAQGLILGSSAFTIWGLLPLYWKLVQGVSPYIVFCHRVVWSFVFVIILLTVRKKLPEFMKMIKVFRSWKLILAPAIFVSLNWLLYIWAVNNNYVIESSLGYFINPLVLTIFGKVFYKEKLSIYQLVGIGLAGAGVLIKSIYYAKVPFLALGLAISFALYGLFKKKSSIDSLNGLAFETLLISFPAVGYILFTEWNGTGIAGNYPIYYWLLMIASGIVTAIPLLMYGEGTKRLPLTVVGFLQYIAPILMLILGVFAFGEPFKPADLIPFILIWIGLILFSYSQYQLLSAKKVVNCKS